MSRIDDVKAFARNAPQAYTAKITKPSIDSMIDAIIATLHKETNMEPSEIEDGKTKVELLRGAGSIILRLGGGFGHGTIPIPHTCHKKLCWPHPEDEDLEVCLEIEIPWPCPDSGLA
jgi:hypothetical protein